MKIGIDATTIYTPQPTGLGIYSINMINELARIHDDLVVWTVDDSRLELPPENIRRVLQPFRKLGNHLFQLRAVWVESILPLLIKKEGVDLLYSTIPNGLANPAVPHVVTVHDLIPLTFPSDSPRTVRWNFRYRLPRILDRAAAIVAVSEFTRSDVISRYCVEPEKVVTISEGYDRACFSPVRNDGILARYGLAYKGYLLYVGSSSPRKNLHNLIRGYARGAGSVAEKLVIVGPRSPDEKVMLDRIIAAEGVSDSVLLINYVQHSDLSAIYSGAKLFLFVSHYEGFGLPLLEAMACGTPVVASKATSLPEVAGDAALLVDPENIDEIAAAIIRTVTDNTMLEQMSAKGLARSELFRWDLAAQQMVALLQSLKPTAARRGDANRRICV